jgi:hypothetical protein
MANEIEVTDLNAKTFVATGSRYSNSAVLKYGENKILTFETYKRQSMELEKTDVYTIVTPGHEYRPDLLSQEYYGVPDLWWKILEANGIMDIFDFKVGTNIRLPKNIFA